MTEMNEDLEFEELIRDWDIPLQFIARRTRAIEKECAKRAECRVCLAPTDNSSAIRVQKKVLIGGIGGISALTVIVDYAMQRLIAVFQIRPPAG